MNYKNSWRACREIWRDDRLFRRLGCRVGWYFLFHYRSRLNERRSRAHPWERIKLRTKGQIIDLEVAAPYAGALKGVFLDDEYDCAHLLSEPPKTVLDLGANIGFGTLYLRALFPDANFAMVEPDPRNLEKLKQNLDRNQITGRVFEAAIGDQPGELRLMFGSNPTCSTLEKSGMHNNENAVTVKLITVPEILQTMGWARIDLLKIDIEGAEEMLLASRTEWLDQVGAILLEIHPNTTPERIQGYLKPYGFTLSRLGNGREPVYIARR